MGQQKLLPAMLVLLVLGLGFGAWVLARSDAEEVSVAQARGVESGLAPLESAQSMMDPGERVQRQVEVVETPTLLGETIQAVANAVRTMDGGEEDAPYFTLSARFIDEQGRPVPGVRVLRLSRMEDPALALADADGVIDRAPILSSQPKIAKSVFTSSPHLQFAFLAPGYAHFGDGFQIQKGTAIELGTIRMKAGGGIEGLALAADGRPFNGAGSDVEVSIVIADTTTSVQIGDRLGLTPNAPVIIRSMGGRVSDRGTFAVYGLEFDQPLLAVLTQDHDVLAVGAEFRLSASNPMHEIDLRLATELPPNWIEGNVTLPSGEPASDAMVFAAYSLPKGNSEQITQPIPTARDGSFRITFPVSSPPAVARVSAYPSEGFHAPTIQYDVAIGTSSLSLELGKERSFEVQVVDSRGEFISWANVRLRTGYSCVGGLESLDLIPAGKSGFLRLPVPQCDYSLQVFAPGYGTETTDSGPPPSDNEVVRVVLQSVPGIHGRVTFDGQPVAGARIGLLQGDRNGRIRVGRIRTLDQIPFLTSIVSPQTRHDATTDSDGRFQAIPPPGERFHLLVQAEGFPRTVGAAFVFDQTQDVEVSVELQRSGQIEGTTGGLQADQYADFLIGASDGSGLLRTSRIDSSGRWTLLDLQPGTWQIHPLRPPASDGMTLRSGREIDENSRDTAEVSVKADHESTAHVDFNSFEESTLTGHLDLSGPSALTQIQSGARAFLTPIKVEGQVATGRESASVRINESGEFRFTALTPGDYVLSIFSGSYSINAGPVELRVGEQKIKLPLRLTEISVRFGDAGTSDLKDRGLPTFWSVHSLTDRGMSWFSRLERPENPSRESVRIPVAVGTVQVGAWPWLYGYNVRSSLKVPKLSDPAWKGTVSADEVSTIEFE